MHSAHANPMRATAFAVACMLLAGPASLAAATRTWDGGGPGNNWNSWDTLFLSPTFGATNWNRANLLPANGDSLMFAGSTRRSNSNTHLSSIANLTFAAGAGAFTLGGNHLSVSGDIKNLSGNRQTINLPVTLSATGATWDGGTMGITFNGALALEDTALSLIAINTRINNADTDLTIGKVAPTGTSIIVLPQQLTLSGGSDLINKTATVGRSTDSAGRSFSGDGGVVVQGPGTRWTSDTLTVGNGGRGQIQVENKGSLISGTSHVGSSAGHGTVTVTGRDSEWTNAGHMLIGSSSVGSLNIQQGGSVRTARAIVGAGGSFFSAAGSGTVTVRGADSRWISTGYLQVSTGGAAVVSILDGGTLTSGGAILGNTLGAGAGSLTVSGANALWSNTGDIDIGMDGRGTLTVRTGGKVGSDSIKIHRNGNVNLEGGTLKLRRLELLGGSMRSVGSIQVADIGNVTGWGSLAGSIVGGAKQSITASGGTLTLGDAAAAGGFEFAGTLNVQKWKVELLSAGVAQLGESTTLGEQGILRAVNGVSLGAGEVLSFTGNARVEGRFLNRGQVSGSGGTLRFVDDVEGAGHFAGHVAFMAGHKPGNSPAAVRFGGGDVHYAPASVLTMEILGGVPGSQYDQLRDIGTLSFQGMLNLVFGAGFTPTAGQQFALFDFDAFTGSLAPDRIQVSGIDRQRLDFSQLGSTGTLAIATPVPEPGHWAMLLVGLGLIGRIARQRLRRTATAHPQRP